jgi:hypothetical protein
MVMTTSSLRATLKDCRVYPLQQQFMWHPVKAHGLTRYQPLAKSRISRPRRRTRAADRCCHIVACKKESESTTPPPAATTRPAAPRSHPRWQIRRAARSTALRWSVSRWSTALRWPVSRWPPDNAAPVTARSIIVWVVPARIAVIAGAVIAGAVSHTA